MFIIFVVGIAVCFAAEQAGNPLLEQAGLSQSMGSMEGKETRFGIAQSSLFATVTTCFTTGSVNNMHDTLTPLGGMVPLINMMLNLVFGGKGVGLMNMILYVIHSLIYSMLLSAMSSAQLQTLSRYVNATASASSKSALRPASASFCCSL